MISWEEEPYLSSHSERDEKKGGRKEKKIQEKEKEKRKGIENVSTCCEECYWLFVVIQD